MPITINGDGTVTGISAGGLPDGSISTADIADNAVSSAKIADDAVTLAKLSTTGTPGAGNFLRGDNSWQEAGGGAWELVSSTNVTSPAYSVDFTGLTNSNYAVVVSKLRPQSDGAQLYSRFGDTDKYQTGFAYHLSECSSTSNTYYAQSGNNVDHMRVCPNMGNEVKEAYSATIYLHGMNEANITPRQTGTYTAGMDGGNEISGFIGGSRIHQGNTSPATQFWRIYCSAGNIDSGRVSLYTIKNS